MALKFARCYRCRRVIRGQVILVAVGDGQRLVTRRICSDCFDPPQDKDRLVRP